MVSFHRFLGLSLVAVLVLAQALLVSNNASAQGARAPGSNNGSKDKDKDKEKERANREPARKDPPREAPRRESSNRDNSPPKVRENSGGNPRYGNDVARQRMELDQQRQREAAQERHRQKEQAQQEQQGNGKGNVVPPGSGGGVPAPGAGGNAIGNANGLNNSDAQAFREQAEATIRAQQALDARRRQQLLEDEREFQRLQRRGGRLTNNNVIGGLPAALPAAPAAPGNFADANPALKNPPPKRAPRQPAEQPIALSDEEITKLLEQLASGDQALEIAALTKLAKSLPRHDRDDVAKAISAHLDRNDPSKRRIAGKALAVWATKDYLPQLREFLVEVPRGVDPEDDIDRPTRVAVLQALGELKEPETMELIGERLVVTGDRTAAAKALKEFGPPAEAIALKYIDHEDKWVRASVSDVLAKVGTDTSIDPLTKVAKDDADDYVRSRAQAALNAVEDR